MALEGLNTLDDLDFKNKKVFLRVDYNVPLGKNGEVLDDYRIKQSIPTIRKLFAKGAKQVIMASHLGRPKDKEDVFRMDRVAEKLPRLTGRSVEKLDDCIDLEDVMPSPDEAGIVVLENIRFHKEEELNDEGFAKKLAGLADVYVNDAFAVCHRKHASVHAITKFLPGCIGLLVEKELDVFSKSLKSPEKPFMAVLGGAKLETKIPLIRILLEKVDKLLLGGGMIFTFYKAKGFGIGKSLVDKNFLEMAKMMNYNEKIVLPSDVVIGDDRDSPAHVLNVTVDKIPSYMYGLDVGKESVEIFKKELQDAKMVVWNGPLGYYENERFAEATNELLRYLADKKDIKVIIGGGDSVAIVEKLGLRDKFFHVSTGGGASMSLMEGKELPAIEALRNK